MKKSNKLLYVIIVILVIALGFCVSISIVNNKKEVKSKSNPDILDIDCNDENCKKEDIEKGKEEVLDKQDKVEKEDNASNDSNTNNTNNNSPSLNDNTTINSNNNNSNNNNNNAKFPSNSDNGNLNNKSASGNNITSGNNQNNTTPSNNDNISNGNEIQGNFEVRDTYQVWTQETELGIFNVDKISPGNHGDYEFIVNNNTNANVAYVVEFDQINIYNANMMYKLKRNGNYVAGSSDEWVYYDKLNLGEKILNSKTNDVYNIEWKWVDADNDTEVGRTKGANYTLKVNIKASETEESDATETSGSSSFNPNTGDNRLYYIELFILSLIILLLLIIKKRQED